MSQKRVLLNFGNNFVKSRPIFKILSLLERELNVKQNLHNMFPSTCLKKIHHCHISKILILHNLAQFYARCKWKHYCSMFNKLLTFSHLLLEMFPFDPHTSSNTTAPLVNCTVNNALLNTVPNVRQRCFSSVTS